MRVGRKCGKDGYSSSNSTPCTCICPCICCRHSKPWDSRTCKLVRDLARIRQGHGCRSARMGSEGSALLEPLWRASVPPRSIPPPCSQRRLLYAPRALRRSQSGHGSSPGPPAGVGHTRAARRSGPRRLRTGHQRAAARGRRGPARRCARRRTRTAPGAAAPDVLRLTAVCAVRDPSEDGPAAGEAGSCAESGRGLHLVESFTDGWGWHPLAGTLPGKIVWALFRLPPHVASA